MCTSIHINFWCVYNLKQSLFQCILSQSRRSLEPKNVLRELRPLNPLLTGSDPPAPLTLPILAFPVIVFSAGFYDIRTSHNKIAWDLSV